MRIALIEPKPPFNSYLLWGKLPLLGNLVLGAILKQAGHEVRVFKENIVAAYSERRDRLHPFVESADAVGMTAITHTVNRAYRIADAIKRKCPGKKIVMGGSHPSALPEEALCHVDQVVVGEAEDVVRDVFEGRVSDRVVRGNHVDLDRVPPVDLTLMEGYRMRNTGRFLPVAPIMASRGCPFDCVFCSVSRMFGREYRIRDADLVLEELRMRYREGYRWAFFYDDNFAARPAKTKVFLEKLIREDMDLHWSSQFSVHVAKDPELVDLLVRAKCHTLFLGVETINPEALKDYHKSQTVSLIESSINTLSEAGLRVHSMFILGADSDTEATIDQTVKFARTSKSSSSQFSILFPIPGTQLYDQVKAENRVFLDDWDYYDGSHSVIIPRNLTPYRLQRKLMQAYKRVYNTTVFRWLVSRLGIRLWGWYNRKYLRIVKRLAKGRPRLRTGRFTYTPSSDGKNESLA